MPKITQLLAIALFSLLTACNGQKQPAEAAFASVQVSVAAVRADLEQYAPEEFAALSDAMDSMKAKLNASDYQGALAMQAGIMRQLSATSALSATVKNKKLRAAQVDWRNMSDKVPSELSRLGAHVQELLNKGKFPAGVTREAVLNVQGALPDLAASWTAAMEVAKQNNVLVALDRGKAVQQRIETLAPNVGLQL